jgi:hypothetical protein
VTAETEQELLRRYDRGGAASAVFILGAPRTGSTALYQAIVHAFGLPFISNSTMADAPIVGILESYRLWSGESGRLISEFGKTNGLHAPSEGSAVMARWCGGGHPSEIMSPAILPNQREHMAATLRTVEGATGKPVVVKNAWNCFRLKSLAEAFPRAGFIWIRRDVMAAARSDLAARYRTKNNPNEWNSATPRNVDELRRRPYWEQVVENQFEFSRAIMEASAGMAPGRFVEVWYEDFCAAPAVELEKLKTNLDIMRATPHALPSNAIGAGEGIAPSREDCDRIDAYLRADPARWTAFRR